MALEVPGIVFTPSDAELLTFYLPRKIAGGKYAECIGGHLVCDFDVYSTEPWKLPRDTFLYQDNKKYMHFFSPRKPTSINSKRVQRTAGIGFWHGSRGDKVYYESQVVGYKTLLNFRYTEGDEKITTNWIMHEFQLTPPEENNKFECMVLCRIYLNKSRKITGDFGSADVGKEEEEGATSAAASVQERPRKRKRVVINTELNSLPSSSLPSSSSSLPNPPEFDPCKEQEALNQLISGEKRIIVTEHDRDVDEARVISLLLKEQQSMLLKEAAESGAESAIYAEERLQKGKWVEPQVLTSIANDHETIYQPSSCLCTPASDSFEEPQVHSQFTSGVASFSASGSEQMEEMGMITAGYIEPTPQDDWKWEDLEIDVGTCMSYFDEVMELINDS